MTPYDLERTQRAIKNILASLGLSGFENVPLILELFSNFISMNQFSMANGSVIGRKSDGSGPVEELTNDELRGFLGIEVDPKVKFTAEGGVAVKLVNKTGANSIKGYCVTAGSADNSVILVAIDVPNCIGVFYESGIPDGSDAWVVVSGIADVYFWNAPTRGYLARTGLTSDTGEISGQALSESVPTTPFAVDKHFCEIGHVLETKGTSGLAKIIMHFN